MSRTENEQEFVLGNKQLLSAFFVVVALLGVFFVMGYIIGRNTNAADPSAKKGTSTEPAPVTTATNVPDAVPAPVLTPDPTPPPAPVERPVEKVEKAAKKVERAVAKPIETETEAPVKQVESASGHTYLQVAALKRPNADAMVKVLKERDFPALLGESSKVGYFRVLVGPYSDPEKLAKAKTDIKKMGFEPAVMR